MTMSICSVHLQVFRGSPQCKAIYLSCKDVKNDYTGFMFPKSIRNNWKDKRFSKKEKKKTGKIKGTVYKMSNKW